MNAIRPVPARASVRSDAWALTRRIALLALILALAPPRLCADVAGLRYGLGATPAFADEGGEGGEGGEGESGEDGGDDGGGDDGGGDDGGEDGDNDGGGDDGDNDGDGHGATGSSIGGFLGALISHGKVGSANLTNDGIVVRYADGWSERVEKGRYQLLDKRNRVVVSRKARTIDLKRLRAAVR